MTHNNPLESSTPPEQAMIDVQGGRVFCRRIGVGIGQPLIVLHGGPGYPHDYLEGLAELGSDRPVIFYDQLGCGRSERPDDPSLWVLDRFVEEFERVRLAAVGDRPVHLLGHSWGSMLAIEIAARAPEHVASLVMDSPVVSAARFKHDVATLRAALPDHVRAVLDREEANGTTGSEAYQRAEYAFFERHLIRIEFPQSMIRSMEGFGRPVYSVMWGAGELSFTGNLSSFDRLDALPELRMPVLYLVGRHDEVPPSAAELYQKRTPASELQIFEESSHMKHLEQPAEYLARVREFLRRADP